MQIGIGLRINGGGGSPGFSVDDTTNGTLILNFVDRPPMTLSLDFLTQTYQVEAADSTTGSEVGYYQSKG